MRVEQPSLNQLGAASEKAIPDVNDGVLNILPVVFPHVPLITPAQPAPGTAMLQTSSFMVDSTVSRINQASTTSNFAVLSRGLWRINWTLSLWTNYLHTGIQTDCSLSILMGVSGRLIAQLYANLDAQSLSGDFLILLRDSATLQLTGGTNGAGQELLCFTGVQAEKLI